MNKSELYNSEELSEELSEGVYPENMEEYQDKWWITKRHLSDLKEFSDTGYSCTIYDHGNIYDESRIETTHFKNVADVYMHVCDYLTKMYTTFKGEDLCLYNIEDTIFPEYNDALSDWKNVYFLLNYGSSSGATPHTVTTNPLVIMSNRDKN